MATAYEVEAGKLIEEAAKELAKSNNLTPPVWASMVKTGMAKNRPPVRNDWWYVRAASVLRTIYTSKGPIGVQKLRVKYGSKKNRGHKPERFYRGSGKIIRLILQQLEKEGYIAKGEAGVHKGREIAPKGRSFLDKIATSLLPQKAQKKPGKIEDKKAEKKQEEKVDLAEKAKEDLKNG